MNAEKLKKIVDESGISRKLLAELTGIKYIYLSNQLNGFCSLKEKTIKKVLDVIKDYKK